jgi:protein-S-isoprenylcysteine O-methyltransferase Ste14
VPVYVYILIVAGWMAWLLPFVRVARAAAPAARTDRRARWGVLIQAFSYALLWQGAFWTRTPRAWRLLGGSVLLAGAAILSWTSTRALGRHFRVDAGLSADHELVRSGPYAWIRHPIYTSMLCVLCGTGLLVTPPALFAAAIACCLVGTEIRVRTEDRLLEAAFGDAFRAYRRRVPAYLPFLR